MKDLIFLNGYVILKSLFCRGAQQSVLRLDGYFLNLVWKWRHFKSAYLKIRWQVSLLGAFCRKGH